ncbi:hypothetical protein Mapa_005593 [Marchantia paleacea]|nr:hypothetical protein Mapa_005593 [Marchantia paleacea]
MYQVRYAFSILVSHWNQFVQGGPWDDVPSNSILRWNSHIILESFLLELHSSLITPQAPAILMAGLTSTWSSQLLVATIESYVITFYHHD